MTSRREPRHSLTLRGVRESARVSGFSVLLVIPAVIIGQQVGARVTQIGPLVGAVVAFLLATLYEASAIARRVGVSFSILMICVGVPDTPRADRLFNPILDAYARLTQRYSFGPTRWVANALFADFLRTANALSRSGDEPSEQIVESLRELVSTAESCAEKGPKGKKELRWMRPAGRALAKQAVRWAVRRA